MLELDLGCNNSTAQCVVCGVHEVEGGDGIHGNSDFGAVYHHRSLALTGCLLSACALSRCLGDSSYI